MGPVCSRPLLQTPLNHFWSVTRQARPAFWREQAVAAAMRRLKPVVEQARKSAHTGGKLCMQLGVLLGLMLGIALW